MKVLLLSPDYNFDCPMGGMGELTRHLSSVVDICRYPFNDTQIGNLDTLNYSVYSQTAIISHALMNHSKPDVVHSFDWSTCLAGVELSRAWKVPMVYSIQLSYPYMLKDMNLKPSCELQMEVEGMAMMYATKIVQVSHDYANYHNKFFLEKTSVIHNPVEITTPTEFSPHVSKNKRTLLYIGRAAKMKGIDLITKCSIPENVEILFAVGQLGTDGNCYESILKYCQDNERAHFLGHMLGQEKVNLLHSVDGVLMPSIHEPFGIVAAEAMAAKKPLITTGTNGIKEFVPVAFWCDKTVESLQKAINDFAVEPEENLINAGEIGFEKAKEMTVDKFISDYMAVYEDSLKRYHNSV